MTRSRIPAIRIALGAATLLLATAGGAEAQAPATDAFLCRSAAGNGQSALQVGIADHLASGPAVIRRARRVCEPVTLDGSAPSDGEVHLVARRTAPGRGEARKRPGIPVADELGAATWDLAKPSLVLLPASVDDGTTPAPPDPSQHSVDAYRCYDAKTATAAPPPAVVEVTTASGGTRRLEVGEPRYLCSPAEVNGSEMHHAASQLACYRAKAETRSDVPARIGGLNVATHQGAATLNLTRDRELCLPAKALPACNGSRHLCERRFDQVAYATTHNAMSNMQDAFVGPNQRFNVARQLSDGVRSLMLDVHYNPNAANQVSLCHTACFLGSRPLVTTLNDIRAFLVRHPYEVVSIIFESYVSAADTQTAFADAGLLDLVHSQPIGQPWPPLAEMIDADRRLVVFTDSQGGTFPWYHQVWDYASETHYSWANPAAMNCAPNRGDPSHSLFILNHFLTQVFGAPNLAELVNHNPFFIDRALQCQTERNRLPNFVTIDFHDIGDVFAVVNQLNE